MFNTHMINIVWTQGMTHDIMERMQRKYINNHVIKETHLGVGPGSVDECLLLFYDLSSMSAGSDGYTSVDRKI